MFTELNHGYINPHADKFADRIRQATSRRDHWVGEKYGPDYYRGLATFNEYMNWGLISLWFSDRAPAPDQDAMIAAVERAMVRRDFRRFAAFNQFLLRSATGHAKAASGSRIFIRM